MNCSAPPDEGGSDHERGNENTKAEAGDGECGAPQATPGLTLTCHRL